MTPHLIERAGMTTLRITVGLPGSGKTAQAMAWVDMDPQNRARVNRDDIRDMLHGRYMGARWQEDQVSAARDAMILRLLRKGISVVADDTNLRWQHLVHMKQLAHKVKVTFEVVSYLGTPISTCIERDSYRDDSIGSDKIVMMWTNALRNMIETWRNSIVEDLYTLGQNDPHGMIKNALENPRASENSRVVALARRYTDGELRRLAPTTTPGECHD